ncbi:MAG: Hsp20/alpha crystallin family protein [Candidatus Anstonellales archaeon]
MEDDFEDEFEIMRKMIKRMFGFDDDLFSIPKRQSREHMPKGYSVTIRIGSDGKPKTIYNEGFKPEDEGFLVDIIPSKEGVKVIMEMPGVEEKTIEVKEATGGIVIEGQRFDGKKVKKRIAVKGIDFKSMQKRYKNGILELSFKAAREMD